MLRIVSDEDIKYVDMDEAYKSIDSYGYNN